MAWPKGKPRKGHIKPDGTPALKKGDRIAQIRKDPKPYEQIESSPSETYVIKGISWQPVIEPCPRCGYAYAEGGYCPDCGNTNFVAACPHCRKGV